MATHRRSARVAAQDTSPDYTEPNESGIKRKASTTQGSPSAKRGKKSKSTENLKRKATLDDTMDIDKPEDSQPQAAQDKDTTLAKSDEPTEIKEPEKPQQTEPEKPAIAVEAPPEDKPAEQPTQQEPESKAEEPTPAAPRSDGEKLTQLPSEPTKTESSEGTTEHKQTSIDAYVSTDKNKSPSVPAPAAAPQQIETNSTKESAAEPGSQKQEDSTPAPPPNTQIDTPKQDAEPSIQPSIQDAMNVDEPSKQEESKPVETAAPTATNHEATPQDQLTDTAPATNGDAIEPKARADDVPSSILEKGIIYFFFRPRVNINDPQDINDIARSYFILRPLPHGAALSDGPIPDGNNARLIAIPKKILPTSGKDRFMVFVEKAKASFNELKNDFMTASDYATKTQGTSHTPPVTPLAEGVYAITTTGRESHLAYMTTIPESLGEVQKDIGLKDSGSFVVSAKNPKFPGPANTNIGKDPGFSSSIMEDFRNLRWMPLQPKLLDYEGCQFLLIGESSGVEKALEGLPRDEKDTDTPMEEMERLEGEDEIRVKHLKGDDAVFADLGLSKKEFPKVPSTW